MSWLDLNLGCPLASARDEHYGAYLLGQKDWPLVENIGAWSLGAAENQNSQSEW
jgi:tRNA-dihydrouridine synthase